MRRDYDQLPEPIRKYGLDFHWDNKKVWALKVSVEEMDIAELAWQFDMPFWHIPPDRYVVSPNQVMNNPEKYSTEHQRILDADMRYPIDIIQNKHGRWEMLDGLHRLARAKLEGKTKVRVRKIPESAIPDIQK